MRRRPRYQRRPSRRISRISASWYSARLSWASFDKAPFIVAALILGVFSSVGFFAYDATATRMAKREMKCLALNVYFEARGESTAGQHAVAEVTLNRVASPRYPNTVCDVVYEENWDRLRKRYVSAFSWTEIEKRHQPGGRAWQRAQRVAEESYRGQREPKLNGATLYHSVHIRPSWSRGVKPVARIGRHVFYKEARRARSG